jgi:xanthine dehydrogenase molybdopterin-binding subunit B
VIVEGEYETGAQEQLYIEPNGMLATPTTSRGSRSGARCSAPTTSTGRWPACSALPAHKIRVVQMETGGGFGGKEEYPSIIAGHAALLAWKSDGP